MQFQVPQFIETEDKVIGPLSWRQFAYAAVAGGISVILFLLLTPLLWFLLSLLVAGIALTLAFVPVNGRPMIVFLRALLNNIWQPKVYVFQPKISETIPSLAMPQFMRREGARTSPISGVQRTEGLRGLRQWFQTSKTPLPQREGSWLENLAGSQQQFKERYEILRRLTGEREVARRVDYR